jgi:hypothetical protein
MSPFTQQVMGNITNHCVQHLNPEKHVDYNSKLKMFMDKQSSLVIYPRFESAPAFTFAGVNYLNPNYKEYAKVITRNLHPSLAKEFAEFLDEFKEYLDSTSALKSYLNRVYLFIKAPFEFLEVVPEFLVTESLNAFINNSNLQVINTYLNDEHEISLFKKMNASVTDELKIIVFKNSLLRN